MYNKTQIQNTTMATDMFLYDLCQCNNEGVL